ncbi:MAG: hypothetical protein ACKVIK_00820 [Rhodospirillales bacterium]|jgi:hypothetical protein
MYADNTLTPREAIRLCALGTLAASSAPGSYSPITYDELVHAVRHFVSRITGPSLELMGESIELLRYEGLVKSKEGNDSTNPILDITKPGSEVLDTLLRANIRAGNSDLNELVITLKFRFLHQLPKLDQVNQIDLILEDCESALARFEDLRNHHKQDPGYLTGWLNHDINRLKTRCDWLTEFKLQLGF